MSKNLLVAFLCAFINLFPGVVGAVSVPPSNGAHVKVVLTQQGYQLPAAVSAGLAQLETQFASLHYQADMILYAPGYRPADMPAVKQQVLSEWVQAGYNPKRSTLVVLMLAPVWAEVNLPTEFHPPQGKNYPLIIRDAGTDFGKVFAIVQEIEQAMMNEDKEVLLQRQRDAEAKATAERAAADKAKAEADRLAAAKAFLQLQVTEFSLREVEAETCCPTEFRDAKNLRGLSTSTEVTGDLASIYELGAKIYKHNRSIDEALLHHQTENRQAAWKMVGWFVLAVILTFVVFWFFTRFEKLRVRLNQLLEKVPDIPEYNGETEKVVLPFRTEFRGYAEELKAMIFTLVEQKGFRFRSPLAFGQLRQQATRLINNVADLLRRWEPINKQIVGIQAVGFTLIANPLPQLRKGTHHALYNDTLARYEVSAFSDQIVYGGLNELLSQNPLGFEASLAHRISHLGELSDAFAELDRLLVEFIYLTEGKTLQRHAVMSQLYELVHRVPDPIGSVLAKLRLEVSLLRG